MHDRCTLQNPAGHGAADVLHVDHVGAAGGATLHRHEGELLPVRRNGRQVRLPGGGELGAPLERPPSTDTFPLACHKRFGCPARRPVRRPRPAPRVRRAGPCGRGSACGDRDRGRRRVRVPTASASTELRELGQSDRRATWPACGIYPPSRSRLAGRRRAAGAGGRATGSAAWR